MESPSKTREELSHLTERVIGAAIEVHRHLGPGFLESIYEKALCFELEQRGVPFQQQVPISVDYKGQPVGEGRLDLLIEGRLVIELKAIDDLAPIHTAQMLSYLRTLGHKLGLLIKFNVPVLNQGIRRIIL